MFRDSTASEGRKGERGAGDEPDSPEGEGKGLSFKKIKFLKIKHFKQKIISVLASVPQSPTPPYPTLSHLRSELRVLFLALRVGA